MTVKASANRFSFDGATVLRAEGSADVTATDSSKALPLDVLSSYWASGELASNHQFAIVVQVEKLDKTTGDETYEFAVEVDSSESFGSAAVVTKRSFNSTGKHVFVLSREEIVSAKNGAAFLRIKATLGGTTPIVAYSAYTSPVVGQ